MVRKAMTYMECDRCDFCVAVESKKGIFGYKLADYPEDWKITDNDDALCPKCAKEWTEDYRRFMAKAKRK